MKITVTLLISLNSCLIFGQRGFTISLISDVDSSSINEFSIYSFDRDTCYAVDALWWTEKENNIFSANESDTLFQIESKWYQPKRVSLSSIVADDTIMLERVAPPNIYNINKISPDEYWGLLKSEYKCGVHKPKERVALKGTWRIPLNGPKIIISDSALLKIGIDNDGNRVEYQLFKYSIVGDTLFAVEGDRVKVDFAQKRISEREVSSGEKLQIPLCYIYDDCVMARRNLDLSYIFTYYYRVSDDQNTDYFEMLKSDGIKIKKAKCRKRKKGK